MLDLTEMKDKLGTRDVWPELARRGLHVIEFAGKLYGVVDPHPLIETITSGVSPVRASPTARPGTAGPHLGRQARRLARNPVTQQLFDGLIASVAEHRPDVVVRHGTSATTFLVPPGAGQRRSHEATLRVNKDNLWVGCWRGGVAYNGGCRVRSDDDFSHVREYLATLPNYPDE